MTCSTCGKDNETGREFCSGCGSELPTEAAVDGQQEVTTSLNATGDVLALLRHIGDNENNRTVELRSGSILQIARTGTTKFDANLPQFEIPDPDNPPTISSTPIRLEERDGKFFVRDTGTPHGFLVGKLVKLHTSDEEKAAGIPAEMEVRKGERILVGNEVLFIE